MHTVFLYYIGTFIDYSMSNKRFLYHILVLNGQTNVMQPWYLTLEGILGLFSVSACYGSSQIKLSGNSRVLDWRKHNDNGEVI